MPLGIPLIILWRGLSTCPLAHVQEESMSPAIHPVALAIYVVLAPSRVRSLVLLWTHLVDEIGLGMAESLHPAPKDTAPIPPRRQACATVSSDLARLVTSQLEAQHFDDRSAPAVSSRFPSACFPVAREVRLELRLGFLAVALLQSSVVFSPCLPTSLRCLVLVTLRRLGYFEVAA